MKHNKFNTWLTSLLVMVMLAFVGQTAMAQDATFDLRNVSENPLTDNGVAVTYAPYGTGGNIWGDHNLNFALKVTAPTGKKIGKIEFDAVLGYDYGGSVVENTGQGTSFEYNRGGTSIWQGNSSEVTFVGTSSDTDIYVTLVRVWFVTGGEEPPVSDFPKTGVAYSFKESTSSLYLNLINNSADRKKDVILGSDAEALYFTAVTGGFTISNAAGLYVGKYTGNTWNMSSNEREVWTVEAVGTGYALKSPQGYLGFDTKTSGSAAYRDKAQSARAIFNIEEMDMSDKTYTVNVTGNPSAATVTVKGVDAVGGTVTVAGSVAQTDVVATEIAGYEYTVSISGDVITVTYSKLPDYIEFITTGLSGSGNNMYNKTIGGVTINGAVYSGYLDIWNSSWTATISSSSFEIEKIEFECVQNYDMGCSVGSMDNSTKTWTGSAKSVTFTAGGDLYISRVRVYLKTPELQEYTVSITGNPSEAKLIYGTDQYANGDSFTAAVSESDLSATEIAGYVYNITIDGTTINVVYSEAPSIKLDYVTVNWGTDHLESGAELEKIESVQVYLQDAIDYIDGVPTGMTFTDAAGNEQTISYCYMQGGYDSSMNYIYNGFYFSFSNTITTPGTYTLHIPAGAIKNTTTGLENKEINFQFVIPTPVQFAAPVLTPAEGNVESLKEFTLTAPTGVEFDTTRSLINITINGNTENIYNYEYATDGSALTFSLSSEYTTDGTVTVVLPLGFVRSTVGEYCPEVTATYTVVYPWYQFESWGGLNPASGSELKSLSTITIDAPTNVTFDCTSEGEARNVTIKVGGVDETVEANVYADHIVLNYATTAVGSYDFVIPASTFAANSATKGNKEFSFSYAILPTLKVGEVTWTTFCYDYNFTLPDGYTPYIIKTAEDGVATPVEVLGAPKTETIKGYIYNYMGDPDMQATVNGDEITAPNFDGKVQVTFGGDFSVGGDYYDVYSGAWVEVVGLNGTEVVSVSPRSWDPYSYESYNFNTTTISGGIRIEWNGYSYFGGLDINIAVAGEYEKPVIPANTGILVQGDPAQDITYEKTYAAASDVSGNILTGCTADNTVTNDADHLYYKFSLNANRDAGSEGFYWDSADGHSINMHAGKAYLILDATSSIRGFRLFGEETESISNVQDGNENAPAFNLQGQRVNKNNFRSGLYIQNGKKVLVK